MQLLSQRDPRWASVKLGTGTIGDRGYTITGYAYIKPLNPSNSTSLTLPGTVTGGGVTLQKIKDIDQKTPAKILFSLIKLNILSFLWFSLYQTSPPNSFASRIS
jgi:hypothetical protein